MAITLTTVTGAKLRTTTQRRYVVVPEFVVGRPFVEYRTDDLAKARTHIRRKGEANRAIYDTVTGELIPRTAPRTTR